MKKYFFIDYGNTIFSHCTHTIPESTATALLSLQNAGHKVFLASGRGLSGAETFLYGRKSWMSGCDSCAERQDKGNRTCAVSLEAAFFFI
ncbi:MAG: HAD hydrolase family protein [Lachnospiraceae bacterium]|jgi:hydroxymethylpyrimidine pyrophosphatase-like HAD family hydrolase|nr:HAD hydrolase family protein [Lachnospiraceae bacterium]